MAAPPAWYALETPPQAEAEAARWLAGWQVETWFPTETVTRKVGRRRKTVVYDRPIISGFIFGLFTREPQWDVLFTSRRVTGVISVGGRPRPITEAEIAKMEQVPDRIAEERRKAAEAKIVRPGDKVAITDGAMAGWMVTVSAVEGDMARFMVPILGGHETEISVCRVVKTQGLA